MAEDFPTIEREATRALGQDPNSAFQSIRKCLAYPGTLQEQDWAPALALFSRVATKIAGPAWATYPSKAAENPSNVSALYDLGYQLIEQQLPDIAATVLARANDLAPGIPKLISEFCTALEDLQAFQDADRILHQNPQLLDSEPFLQYLAGFYRLMLRDIQGARFWANKAKVSDNPQINSAFNQLKEMLARAQCLRGVSPLDERDLRGWQFVTSGSLLLHLSPYGLDEGMHGRYAFLQD